MKKPEIVVCGLPFDTEYEKEALIKTKETGATAVQIYVYWNMIEPEERGKFVWDYYDRQVKLIQEAGLKWVPFLIFGPGHALPGWWKESEGHCGMACLEHEKSGWVESVWNPAWRTELSRLLEAFAEHYMPWNVIESVQPGISGDYGEAIYPAIANWPGMYHTHYGYWCTDKYALASFRAMAKEKYGTVEALNDAWNSKFSAIDTIKPFKLHKAPSRTALFDFMQWYKGSMSDYVDFWMRECRRVFGDLPVYLCTGGDGEPYLGADFSEQARACAKYGGGIRLTNEGNLFSENYTDTVHCASACRYYGAYMGLEPVGPVRSYGVTARIFGTAAYGNRQLFHYYGNLFDGGAKGAENAKKYHYLVGERDVQQNVAVFLPQDMIWIEGTPVPENIRQALTFVRRQYETSVMNETMIEDGALNDKKVLIMLGAKYTRKSVLDKIAAWVKAGGTLLTDERTTAIEGENVASFDEALGFTEDSLYEGGISDFYPVLADWNREFNEKDRVCNKISWAGLADDVRPLLSTKPREEYRDGILTNRTTLLHCAFEHPYGGGRAVYYCGPMNLVPEKDPMFGVGDAFSHILADLLREFAGIEPLGTKEDELGRARMDGKILVHKHDDIYFLDN